MTGQRMSTWLVKPAGLVLAALLPLAALAGQAPAQSPRAANPAPQPAPPAQPASSLTQIIQQAVQQALAQQAAQTNPNGINLRGRDGSQVQIQLTPEQQEQIALQGEQIARDALRPGGPAQRAIALGILVPISFFAMLVLIIYFVTRRRGVQIRAQAELRKQLIDKFGSGQELAAFLESKGGQQFFEDMRHAGGLLRFLPAGITFTMVGLALLGLATQRHPLVEPGVIFLALGIGLLLSAAIGHKLMSRRNGDSSISGAGPGSGMTGSGMTPLPRA